MRENSSQHLLDISCSTTRMLGRAEPEISLSQNGGEDFGGDGKGGVSFHAEGGLRKQGWYKRAWPGRYIVKDNAVELLVEDGETPCVSIITVVYNAADTIEHTIKSVLEQSYSNIEYIVIDGGSTDGTVDIIRSYENKIDYWVSERDTGIYNAMNKGLSVSTGQVIAFLNAQDTYFPDTVTRVVEGIEQGYDYVYGNIVRVRPGRDSLVTKPLPESQLGTRGIYEMGIPHMALFVRSEVFKKVGNFDEAFRVAADHDFVNRIVARKYSGKNLDVVLARFACGGISSGVSSRFEDFHVARKAGAPIVMASYHLISRLAWHYFGSVVTYVFGDNAMNYIRKAIGSRYVNTE